MRSSQPFWTGCLRQSVKNRLIFLLSREISLIQVLPATGHRSSIYRFLSQAALTCCRHIIITGGNHDSPSFLDAPKGLLKAMNIHVVGSATENPGDQVLLLSNGDDPELIVCAVPYLRDRDIRTASPGEALDDKSRKLVEGVRKPLSGCLRYCQENSVPADRRRKRLYSHSCDRASICCRRKDT